MSAITDSLNKWIDRTEGDGCYSDIAAFEAGWQAAIEHIKATGLAGSVHKPSGQLRSKEFLEMYSDCVEGSAGVAIVQELEPLYRIGEE